MSNVVRTFAGRTRNFVGESFWARVYFVSTVGRDEQVIREYIRRQESEDQRQQRAWLLAKGTVNCTCTFHPNPHRADRILSEKQTTQSKRAGEIPQIHEQGIESSLFHLLLLPLPEKQPAGRIEVTKRIGGQTVTLSRHQFYRIAIDRLLLFDQRKGFEANESGIGQPFF
ncbi:MAG: transposase [Desulfuromonadales bacterium]|nr:transposase [Desulfuromonadales bacterium]